MRKDPTSQPEQPRAATKYTFPHVVSALGEQLTLRRVPGRARIVYDYNPSGGIRDKRIIPREAGDVGLPLPDSDRVPEDAITWAEAYLEEQALAKSRLAEKVLAAETTPAGTTLKVIFDEYRKSTEYAGLRPKYAREMAAVM